MENGAATLSPHEKEVILAFMQALLPPGRVFPGATERTFDALCKLLGSEASSTGKVLGRILGFLDFAALARTGRRFSKLPAAKQADLVQHWVTDTALRTPLMGLGLLLKAAHFDHPEIYGKIGYAYEKGGPAEPAKWLSQIYDGAQWEDGGVLECDVVVVGSGAGGAVVGTELALQGHAVVFVEEGKLYRRDAFNGNLHEAHNKFYRNKGAVMAVGNTFVPILMGKLVGGSTAINTGVSYHTPDRVLNRFCETTGCDEFEPDRFRKYFDRVERELDVRPVDEKWLGGVARVVAKGCDRLGWHHYVLGRNAPDCEGEGVCDLGCPAAARRSVDVSYLPQAFGRGAVLFKETRAERVLIENGKAVGIVARAVENGRSIWIRARAVVLAGGAVPTPLFLLGQGICNESGQVGRNLSVHPSTGCSGLFDERIEQEKFVPNTRACDEFLDEGILLQTGQGALSMVPITIPFVGRPLMDIMDRFQNLAGFGVMIEDAARTGRVRRLASGQPFVTYRLTKRDVANLHKGMVKACEMWLAAGAEAALPLLFRFPEVRTRDDLSRFEKFDVKPWEFLLTSWHPLGTCDMGPDPKKHVVNSDHETHGVKNLFIADGSTVPGPLGVNPQITIMAMATRAAEKIHERLG